MKNISIKSVFREAQEVFMKAPWHWVSIAFIDFLILLACIPLLSFVTAAIGMGYAAHAPWLVDNVLPPLTSLAFMLVVWTMLLGFYRMAEAALAGTNPQIRDIFRHDTRTVPFVLTSVCVAVITFFASKVFVIPGLIASVIFFFADISTVEEHTGPIDSLHRSYELVRRDWRAVVLFMLASGLFTFVAIIPFGLGLLLYIPLLAIAKIIFFREVRNFEPMVMEKK